MRDVRELTVQEVCDLAAEINQREPGSRRFVNAADQMYHIAWHLHRAGALRQMLALVIEDESTDAQLASILRG